LGMLNALEMIITYKTSDGVPEGKRFLGRTKESSSKRNPKEIGCEIWAGLMWFRTGVSGQYCQQGTKIFASTKNGVL